MLVISETEARTTTTPAATMYGLAAPSQGSTEISTWRVEMPADHSSPVHVITREQVWMPVSGTFHFTVGEETEKVSAGQALVVPAGVARRFSTGDGPAQALVCMPVGGKAQVVGDDALLPVPWAE